MASAVSRKVPQVLLGYPDEKITDKYLQQVDFTTSKIGGFPVRIPCYKLHCRSWKPKVQGP